MITKEVNISKNGDCIVAVAADKATADLSPQFKQTLKKQNANITIAIEVGDLVERIVASGSPNLSLHHPTDIVIRKSVFISDRTPAIRADKASSDLPRQLVEKLQNPKQQVKITLIVEA